VVLTIESTVVALTFKLIEMSGDLGKVTEENRFLGSIVD
jgi:hypothetical protein